MAEPIKELPYALSGYLGGDYVIGDQACYCCSHYKSLNKPYCSRIKVEMKNYKPCVDFDGRVL